MKEKKEIIDQFYNERFTGSSLPDTKADWNGFKHYTKKRKQGKYFRNTGITVITVISVLSLLLVLKNYVTDKAIETKYEKAIPKIETTDSSIPILPNHSTKLKPQTEQVKKNVLPKVKNNKPDSSKRIIFDKEKLVDPEESDVVTSDSTLINRVQKNMDTLHRPLVIKQDTNRVVINKKVVLVNKKTIIKRELSTTDSSKKRK
jgi:hypothetical protein